MGARRNHILLQILFEGLVLTLSGGFLGFILAALAVKLHKPLSARLFPIPGKAAGDAVQFANPFLTDSVVMPAE